MKFVVAQLGARNNYNVPTTFERAGILEKLYTDLLASDPGFKQAVRIPGLKHWRPLRQIAEKTAGGTPPSKTHTFPVFGFKYWLRLRMRDRRYSLMESYLWAGREFCKRVARAGFGMADAVYTFNSAGLEILEAAKPRGLFTVMEQTIAPMEVERQILGAEREAYQQWQAPVWTQSSVQTECEQRERAEANLADAIVCPSEFVRTSISKIGWPSEKCVVVPYSADAVRPPNQALPPHRDHGKLQVLFVGQVDLRKGVHYAAAAAASLRSVADFSMLGVVNLSEFGVRELQKSVTLLGVLPRGEVQQRMAMAHVLILPSLCEGSATVCYEAFAAGLPVITTENAGSFVRDGIDGFIIPIRDVDSIVDCVTKLAADRNLLQWMSKNASNTATQYTSQAYGQRLLKAMEVGVGI